MPGSYTRTNHHREIFAEAARTTNEKKAVKQALVVAEYNLNPTRCNHCDSPIPYLKRKNKFCSKSCGAKVNNHNRPSASRLAQQNTIRMKYRGDGSDFTALEYREYKQRCGFGFLDYSKIAGGELVKELGWYHPIKNPNGAARDHLLSISDAFKMKVDPAMVSHVANCQIISQAANASKGSNSSISLSELIARIYLWGE